MFTGIITHTGILQQKKGDTFTFSTDHSLLAKIQEGTSISINGVCLTALAEPKADTFRVQIMPETSKKTMLDSLKEGNIANLELPVTAETLLSGHIVQGHVDGLGTVKDITQEGNSHILTISVPEVMSKYLITKGSICLNGISLTVVEAHNDYFTVGIIPYTWEHTMLSAIQPGDEVNIEVDMLAKYVEKLYKKNYA
ncbi:MAG: riboflavin synthase [Patescibacteria group bacterium]